MFVKVKSLSPLSLSSLSVSQPYYSTRVNAADIDSRVKLLDQTAEGESMEGGADKKIKAGFWEEFDVGLTSWCAIPQVWPMNPQPVLSLTDPCKMSPPQNGTRLL